VTQFIRARGAVRACARVDGSARPPRPAGCDLLRLRVMWASVPAPEEQRQVTLFRHMWGLLLGAAELQSAATSFQATAGHGPDSDVWWEHLFLLRVERGALLAMLRTASEQPDQQPVLRLCCAKCLQGLQRPWRGGGVSEVDHVRAANCCATLGVVMFDALHLRKLAYAQSEGLWGPNFIEAVLDALHRTLADPSPVHPAAPGLALQLLLTLASTEAALSTNATLGRVLAFISTPAASAAGDQLAADPAVAALADGFPAVTTALLGRWQAEGPGAAGAEGDDAALLLVMGAHYQVRCRAGHHRSLQQSDARVAECSWCQSAAHAPLLVRSAGSAPTRSAGTWPRSVRSRLRISRS
jgi:hypothetical protein